MESNGSIFGVQYNESDVGKRRAYFKILFAEKKCRKQGRRQDKWPPNRDLNLKFRM
jgi:hypothetical protein